MFSGANEFLYSNVKIVHDYNFDFDPRRDFITFITSNKAKEFTIVSDELNVQTRCEKYGIKNISLLELEKLIVFDEERFNEAIDDIEEEYNSERK